MGVDVLCVLDLRIRAGVYRAPVMALLHQLPVISIPFPDFLPSRVFFFLASARFIIPSFIRFSGDPPPALAFYHIYDFDPHHITARPSL